MISKVEKFLAPTEISAEQDFDAPQLQIKAKPRYMLLNAYYWTILLCFNIIQGKSMLENKSSQIARDYMGSYVGYLHDERIIATLSWNAFQV